MVYTFDIFLFYLGISRSILFFSFYFPFVKRKRLVPLDSFNYNIERKEKRTDRQMGYDCPFLNNDSRKKLVGFFPLYTRKNKENKQIKYTTYAKENNQN